jgi:hypothetical protein
MAALLEQEDQRLRVAFRNSAVIFVTNPGFTVVLALLLLLVAVASTFFVIPWIVTLALIAIVCNKAVLHLLKPHRERMRKERMRKERMRAEREELLDQDEP